MLRSKKSKIYSHIIFDFDGTLADTLPQSLDVINDVLGRKDTPLTEKNISRILGFDNIQDILDEVGVSRLLIPYYVYQFRKKVKPTIAEADLFAGVEETLSYLFDRASLSIISSNSTENVEIVLRKYGIHAYFENIEGGVSVFGKARALKKFVRSHNLRKSHVLYVGDEVRDIVACKKVKLDIATASWGPTPKKRLIAADPTYCVDTLKQLKKFVT